MIDLHSLAVTEAASLLNAVEPDATRKRMVLAPDLVGGVVGKQHLAEAAALLAKIIADEAITNAELKGLLNRVSARTWGVEYDRTFKPREFLAELIAAIDAGRSGRQSPDVATSAYFGVQTPRS
ncbi:MAG: hypothetical protein ACK4UQ_07165 [Brevundimonas sp.]